MRATALFTAILVSGLIPVPVQAQEPAVIADPVSDSPNHFYFDFKKTRLLQVLTVLSELTGINFVAGKEISEREVSMKLDNVTLPDALEALSRGSNVSYDYIPNRNIYLFRAAADPENLPLLRTRVFKLYYALASPNKEIESGEGSGGSSSSSTGTFENLSESDTSKESAPILTVVQNMLSERGRVNVDSRSNSLVVTDTEDRLQMIEQVIAQLDKKLDQVLIEVILIETFEDLDRNFGIQWTSTANNGTFAVLTGGNARTRFPFNLKYPFGGNDIFGKEGITNEEINTEVPTATTFGTKDFSGLQVTLKALQLASKLKILAKPRILVLDNHPALVKITTNASIGQNSVATATGQLTSSSTTTTERTETGTALRLTPHINADGQITLTVEPRFVTLAASSVTSLANSTADPTIRTARTTLMLHHGQTVAIGGLLSSQQSNTMQKVPYLGDMPLVGEAFRRRSKSIEDRELILFITPYVIRDASVLEAVSVPDQRESYDEENGPFWKKLSKGKNKIKDAGANLDDPAKLQKMDEAIRSIRESQTPEPQAKAAAPASAPAPSPAPKSAPTGPASAPESLKWTSTSGKTTPKKP